MTSEISEPQSRMEIQQAPNQNDQEVQEQESRKYDAFNDKELKKLKRFHTFFEEKATDIRKQNEDILKISQEMKSERDSIGNADYTTPDVILEINAAKRSCYDGRNKCKRKAKTNATSGGDLQKEGLSSLTGHKDANEARCNARIRLNAQQMTEFCLDKEGIENMRARLSH